MGRSRWRLGIAVIQFPDIFSGFGLLGPSSVRASVEVLEFGHITGSVVQLTASKMHLLGRPVFEEEHATYDLMSQFSLMINFSSPPLRLAAMTRTSEDSLRASELGAVVGHEKGCG